MSGNTKLSVRAVKRRPNQPRQTKPKRTVVPSIHRRESRAAKFYMFTYKVGNGRRSLSFHNGTYNYGPQRCPNSSCTRGKKCHFAHGALEVFFHPLRYKTQRCSKGEECDLGEACARAHSNDELRILWKILGRNWRMSNPVSAQELAELEERKEKKRRGGNTRVTIGGPISNPPSKAGSVKPRSIAARSATPMSQSTTTVAATRSEMSSVTSFASPSPALDDGTTTTKTKTDEEVMSEEREERVEDVKEEEMEVVVKEKNDQSQQRQQGQESEFAWWINIALGGRAGGYVAKFEACDLDDLSLLWNLYEEEPDNLVEDVLVSVIGMSDERDRKEFVSGLCEYKSPRDVRGWLERVVCLPRYVRLFEEYESVEDLCYLGFDEDDLTEMGISSVGHRAKILYHLRRFQKKGGEELAKFC